MSPLIISHLLFRILEFPISHMLIGAVILERVTTSVACISTCDESCPRRQAYCTFQNVAAIRKHESNNDVLGQFITVAWEVFWERGGRKNSVLRAEQILYCPLLDIFQWGRFPCGPCVLAMALDQIT